MVANPRQLNADPVMLAFVARGDAANIASGSLTEMDEQCLRAIQGRVRAIDAEITSLFEQRFPATRDSALGSSVKSSADLVEEVSLPTLKEQTLTPVDESPPATKAATHPAGESTPALQAPTHITRVLTPPPASDVKEFSPVTKVPTPSPEAQDAPATEQVEAVMEPATENSGPSGDVETSQEMSSADTETEDKAVQALGNYENRMDLD